MVCAILSRGQTNIEMLSLDNIATTYTQQGIQTQCDTTINLNYSSAITGLSVSGTAILNHASNSLVRITLQDEYDTEYLVYELYPLLADSATVTFENVAFETSVLDNVMAERLNIKVINGILQLDEISTSTHTVSNYTTRQISTLNAQNTYMIDKLNENLEKNNMPWRAGETTISQLTYEEKKALFGGEVPNLGGFEYYVGGVFVMPNYDYTAAVNPTSSLSATNSSTSYVPEWDWRNRHGKNWVTSVKNQGNSATCWAFAALGALEAYVNLYFNRLLDLDLSEQELVSCTGRDSDYYGGWSRDALEYIIENGVMDEDSFSFLDAPGNCSDKPTSSNERIWIESYITLEDLGGTVDNLKGLVHKAPLALSVASWGHAVTLVGYKVLEVGDRFYVKATSGETEIREWITIEEGNPFIGATAWIVKNSYGTSQDDNGYVYLITNISDIRAHKTCLIQGNVTSLNSIHNILLTDADNDGYYFWGVGERPTDLPSWAQEEADGDDSNPLYGALDAYGHLENISLASFPDITINAEVAWNEDDYIYNNVRVVNGGKLIVSADVKKYFMSTITIEDGGELIIDGGSITRGSVIVKSNGEMSITGGGELRLSDSNNFRIEQGGIFYQSLGKIQIID